MADPSGVALFGDSNLGRDLAAVDWASTALGDVQGWPAALRNAVRLMLGSRFAMWMAWGPDLTFLCNDAYRRDTLGAKYPWALGRPAREVWSEIWPDIGPRIESVLRTGVATWDEALMLILERSGYPEETYHTFSYSPISDDLGAINGMLCVVSEDTARVVSERRMSIVRDVGGAVAVARTEADVCAAAAATLAGGRSMPFVAGYLFDDQGTARRAFTALVPDGHPVAPPVIDDGVPGTGWPIADVRAGRTVLVDDLADRFDDLPCGAWDLPPVRALLLPFGQPGSDGAFGFMIAAVNRYRGLDSDYRDFLGIVAGQIAAGITRARAYEQERERADALAELDRAKTAFFTNVSHELRTPLTLLLGPTADALQDPGEPLSPGQRDRLQVVQRNAERLLKLVNTLLDFSRLEAGAVRARYEPLDLPRYTSELAAMFDSALTRAGLTLTVETEPLPAPVYVDREMWAKIVLNLMSNALKATFTGGVTVRLSATTDDVALAVTDTGVGIPADEQPRLFERFHRVTGAALRSHEGSGIGLALVAELAALHGGGVEVHSTPGVGSEFTVRVPFGTRHLPADQVADAPTADGAPVEHYGRGYLAEADRWLAGDQDAAPEEVADRPSVLVVDDNADMRAYVADLLRREYRVVTAVDGVDGLERARAEVPDLVLSDVMMPRLDGFGLLQALRRDATTMHVPIVLLSARAGDEATVAGLEAGADDYLVKPFSARELLARVRANLELDRVRRVADELSRSRALLAQAEELARLGSWELEPATGRLEVSAEYCRVMDLDPDVVSARAVLDRIAPEDRRRVTEAYLAAMADGDTLDEESAIVRSDGRRRLVRSRAIVIRGADGSAALLRGSVQDVTDQREAERAAATARAAAEAAAREHEIAEELQRSLLPAATYRAEGLTVVTYYRSGVEGTQAGGDWYDVIDLDRGRTGLLIGDVMGRGVRAAAVMGQLRATVHAYARLGLTEAEVLTQLDAAVAELPEPMIATCVYAVYDPRSATLTYCNAGHLPPLLAAPGVAPVRLTTGDPPLGTGRFAGRVGRVAMEPGAVLTLYTDGLVERRRDNLDNGIDHLGELLTPLPLPVESAPAAVVAGLLPNEPDDDVAVLIAQVADPGEPQPVSVALPAVGTAASQARDVAQGYLAGLGLDVDAEFDVLVVVSELVTNAVRHGRAPIVLRLRCDGEFVVVEVSDGGSELPRIADAAPADVTGRGLHLVAALSASWGCRPTGSGKAVWSCVHAPASDAIAAPESASVAADGER